VASRQVVFFFERVARMSSRASHSDRAEWRSAAGGTRGEAVAHEGALAAVEEVWVVRSRDAGSGGRGDAGVSVRGSVERC
jgi:hypothetical protein